MHIDAGSCDDIRYLPLRCRSTGCCYLQAAGWSQLAANSVESGDLQRALSQIDIVFMHPVCGGTERLGIHDW